MYCTDSFYYLYTAILSITLANKRSYERRRTVVMSPEKEAQIKAALLADAETPKAREIPGVTEKLVAVGRLTSLSESVGGSKRVGGKRRGEGGFVAVGPSLSVLPSFPEEEEREATEEVDRRGWRNGWWGGRGSVARGSVSSRRRPTSASDTHSTARRATVYKA